MKMHVQMIFLGTGEKKYHDLLERAQSVYPQQIGIRLGFDTPLSHLIEAGSDMFLMPSRYEPCGLNQIYSLRYGTVPIVRATGGLDDTIEDFRPDTQQGTGFKFQRYDSGELLHTIHRAVETYKQGNLWKALIRNGMTKDYSWGTSAKKYVELYHNLVGN
jgi:starch synthase